MAEFVPYPFGRLVGRVLRDLDAGGEVLGLPARSLYAGDRTLDFSTRIHGRRASSPLGPAAGPHTQLAPNIVAAWLAGARVFELKTVQVQDRLAIPRPCIDMRNVGYNVEWSQELRLHESLDEYVKASMALDILKARGVGLAPEFDDSLFDMSVGYDLAGVQSEPVRSFIRGLQDADAAVERFRAQLPRELAQWREVAFNRRVSASVTLSTFHGCPPGEIERLAVFLLRECGLDTAVKLNPTLLGQDETRRLLNETLGYRDIRIPDSAFEKDARWDQVLEMVDRLDALARGLGRGFAVKFSNTLVVDNPGDFLPAAERTRYLSGAPLHLLAMHLVRRFRRQFADRIPISFSAGIDRLNFPEAVALGLAPITACSDLLKPGGYGRLRGYYEELSRRMTALGAGDLESFVRRTCPAPAESASEAALRNTELYVAAASREDRYGEPRNSAPPKKVGTRLSLFDCLACDKCVTACPNGANFVYRVSPGTIPAVRLERDGAGWVRRAGGSLEVSKFRQIAHFGDFCNECGNCDVFCPEEGGPHRAKPRFFGSLAAWKSSPLDGFFAAREEDAEVVYGRFNGRELLLRAHNGRLECLADGLRVRFPAGGAEGPVEGASSQETDLTPFFIMDALRRAVLSSENCNHVNA
ncbi:MAG: glutamate synthase [Elusimicrobia bacterium]|nr:glutamate synthase [Elusimicrobiota bacterium]